MKKYLMPIFWFLVLSVVIYAGYDTCIHIYSSLSQEILPFVTKIMLCVFVAGVAVSALVFDLLYTGTTDSLNIYKRELEKESVDKLESSSKIKVLESKIEVLEKALDEALKK